MDVSWSGCGRPGRRAAGRVLAVLAVALVLVAPVAAGDEEEPAEPAAPAAEDQAAEPESDEGPVAETLAAIRMLATALEAYDIDNGRLPEAGSVGELAEPLVPVYIDPLPQVDGWGNQLVVVADGEAYEIRSLGRDGERDEGSPQGETDDLDRDIVMERPATEWPRFTQWPRGAL